MSINKNGQVIYKLKKAYDNGTTHIVLEPVDLLARLASLVPRPRVNLTRFFGVFAPNFKHRKLVVPAVKKIEDTEEKTKTPEQKKYGMTWAQRLKRVFNIDINICGHCQGQVKVIACIEDPRVISKILTHLGLDATPPNPWPPRPPPMVAKATYVADEYQQAFPETDF